MKIDGALPEKHLFENNRGQSAKVAKSALKSDKCENDLQSALTVPPHSGTLISVKPLLSQCNNIDNP